MSQREDQFREQLVDYLYGELDGAQRVAFEAELAASPEHRAELAAMRATLRTARSGLAALNEEPPAHLRAAILAGERAVHAPKVVALKPWYRRASALVPALAAAAAVAFAVLAPRRDHQLDRGLEEDAPASPAEPAQPVAAPAAPPPESEGLGGAPREAERAEPSQPTVAPVVTAQKSARRRAASSGAPSERKGAAEGEHSADDLARAGGGYAKPPPGYAMGSAAPSREEAPSAEVDNAADKSASVESRAAAPVRSAPMAAAARDEAAPAPEAAAPMRDDAAPVR
ncbi:MAG TPA: hypothetical protein VI299_26270, partial [Polyangiales bacterium]